MANQVVVMVPGVGPLALTPEALRNALARGREVLGETASGAPVRAEAAPELVDAAELERRSGIPASWWMARARERRVPFRKVGRYVRFDPVEALGCEAFTRQAIPDGAVGQRDR